jgi:hypothetical protein
MLLLLGPNGPSVANIRNAADRVGERMCQRGATFARSAAMQGRSSRKR